MTVLKTGLFLGLLIASGAAFAAPDASIRNSVAVCDPYNPTNCLQPNANGTTDKSYQLLTNAAATGPAVSNVPKASYLYNVVGTFGSGCNVTLQALASDGATYQTVYAATAPGTTGVVLGNLATVRAAISGTCSGIYASLS